MTSTQPRKPRKPLSISWECEKIGHNGHYLTPNGHYSIMRQDFGVWVIWNNQTDRPIRGQWASADDAWQALAAKRTVR